MWCVDIGQSKTADGFEALVVSKQKQDIGLFSAFAEIAINKIQQEVKFHGP